MSLRPSAVVRLILPLGGVFALLSACSSSDPAPSTTPQAGANGVAGAAGASVAGGSNSAGSAGAIALAGAGGSSAAGAGGASGGAAGSAASSAGSSAAGGGNLPGVVPSTGCGAAATQALGSYVKLTETVPNVEAKWQPRNYYVRLPANYNPAHPYPTVYVGPGCGATGDKGIPIWNASGNDAIVIGLDPSPSAAGRACFNTETYPDPEVDYFVETKKQVEAKFCVDKAHVFVEGFSSGSWLTNLLGCTNGDQIKAQGNASGCMQGAKPAMCKGPIPFMGAHDMGDDANSYACGKENRDRIVKLNGCTDQTMPYDPGPMITKPNNATVSCVQYVGCMPGYPVVWCTTTGLGHNDQVGTGLSTYGFWKFWMSL